MSEQTNQETVEVEAATTTEETKENEQKVEEVKEEFDYGKHPELAKHIEKQAKEYYRTYLRGKFDVYKMAFGYLLKHDLDYVEQLINDRAQEYQEHQSYDRVDACDELFKLIKKRKRELRKKSM